MNALGAKRQYQNSKRIQLLSQDRRQKYRDISIHGADSYMYQKFILIEFPDKRKYQLNASFLASLWAMSQSKDVVSDMKGEIFWYSYNHCYEDNVSLLKLFNELDGEFIMENAKPLNTSDSINMDDMGCIHRCKISIVNFKKYPHLERITHLEKTISAEKINPQEFDLDGECPECLMNSLQQETVQDCYNTEAS